MGGNQNLPAPKQNSPTISLARVLSELGDFHHALDILLPFAEKDIGIKILMGELYLKNKEPHKAWDVLQDQKPHNCYLAKLLAKTLLHSEQAQQAVRYYRIALDHCGANNSLSRMLLIARLIEGEELALLEALVLLREKTKNTRIRRLVLHNLARSGDYQSMIPHFRILEKQGKILQEERDDLQRIIYGLPLEYYPLGTP